MQKEVTRTTVCHCFTTALNKLKNQGHPHFSSTGNLTQNIFLVDITPNGELNLISLSFLFLPFTLSSDICWVMGKCTTKAN